MEEARQAGCNLLVTGEASFHSCLEAEAVGLAIILAGHFASERFALEQLALEIAEKLPGVETFASRRESDPLRWLTNSSGSTG